MRVTASFAPRPILPKKHNHPKIDRTRSRLHPEQAQTAGYVQGEKGGSHYPSTEAQPILDSGPTHSHGASTAPTAGGAHKGHASTPVAHSSSECGLGKAPSSPSLTSACVSASKRNTHSHPACVCRCIKGAGVACTSRSTRDHGMPPLASETLLNVLLSTIWPLQSASASTSSTVATACPLLSALPCCCSPESLRRRS